MIEAIPEPLAALAMRLRRQLPPAAMIDLHRQGALPVCRVLPGSEAEAATALAIARDVGVPVVFGQLPRWLRQDGGRSAGRRAGASGLPRQEVPSQRPGSHASAPGQGLDGDEVRHERDRAVAALALTGLLLLGNGRLTRIGAFDARRRLVEVQAGVRLAALNRFLRPHGLWVPVQAAVATTKDVASLVARDVLLDGQGTVPVRTDAAISRGPGKGRGASPGGLSEQGGAGDAWPGSASLVDGLLGIDAVLEDGSRQLFGPFGERSPVRLDSGRAGQLVSALFGIAGGVQAAIADWPWGRQAEGGYRLDSFHPEPARPYTADGSVNLAHLLAGSAGTLAWSGRLHLRPWRRPAVMGGLLLGFGAVFEALAGLAQALPQIPCTVQLLEGAELHAFRVSPWPDDRRLWQTMRWADGGAGRDRLAGSAGVTVATGTAGAAPGELPRVGGLVLMAGGSEAAVQAALGRLARAVGVGPDGRCPGVMLAGDDAAPVAAVVTAGGLPGRDDGGHVAEPVWRQVLDAGALGDAWPLLPPPGDVADDAPGGAGSAPARARPDSRATAAGSAASSAGDRGWAGPPGELAAARETMRAGWQASRLLALAAGEALRLPPLPPARLAAQVAMLDEALSRQGVQLAWRGRLDAGMLQVRLRPGPVPAAQAARQLLAALAPLQQGYWTPIWQRAFTSVRRQFDPLGGLAGDA